MHKRMHVQEAAVSYPAQRVNLKEPPKPLTAEQLEARMAAAFPEAAGPGEESESGEVLYGGRITAHARVGPVPLQRDMADVWKERAEQEAALAAIPAEVRQAAALIEQQMAAERRRW